MRKILRGSGLPRGHDISFRNDVRVTYDVRSDLAAHNCVHCDHLGGIEGVFELWRGR
jgi:hypothetical protein